MKVLIYPANIEDTLSVPFNDVEDIWLINEESFGDLKKVSGVVFDEGGLLVNPANVIAIKVDV